MPIIASPGSMAARPWSKTAKPYAIPAIDAKDVKCIFVMISILGRFRVK